MIRVKTTALQTVQPGELITFDSVEFNSGCGECFMKLIPTSVRLKGGCGSVYDIRFGGNVTNETANLPVQLSIAVGTTTILSTARNVLPVAAGDLWGMESATYFRVCCGDLNRVGVKNTGVNPIVIEPNFVLEIGRKG